MIIVINDKNKFTTKASGLALVNKKKQFYCDEGWTTKKKKKKKKKTCTFFLLRTRKSSVSLNITVAATKGRMRQVFCKHAMKLKTL